MRLRFEFGKGDCRATIYIVALAAVLSAWFLLVRSFSIYQHAELFFNGTQSSETVQPCFALRSSKSQPSFQADFADSITVCCAMPAAKAEPKTISLGDLPSALGETFFGALQTIMNLLLVGAAALPVTAMAM